MQLPIGFDDLGKIVDNELDFVDKTLFIKEVLDDKNTEAIVITRPRRFGKTFNLSLLHYFFAEKVYGRTTADLFNHQSKFKIAQCGQAYMQHQGQYPVVSITFKEVKASNYQSAYESILKLMSDLYLMYEYLLSSPKLSDQHKRNFQNVLEESINEAKLKSALKDLMYYLSLHHEKKVWLLIDEYDTPIQAAYMEGYYNDMIVFMRGLFGAALKNNPYLNKAVITGILRVAKESLFSGVNNLEVYSLLRNEYSEYFGFTEAEVDDILKRSQLSEKAAEIKSWYNGYQFGGTTIYNPWSIANCVKRKGVTEPYWINTSSNELIKDLLKESPLAFKAEFEALMQGKVIEQLIDESMIFADLKKNSLAAWSLLLMSGYLTAISCDNTHRGARCQLRVPNQEVNNLYRTIIELWLANGGGFKCYDAFIHSLTQGSIDEFKIHLENILLQIVSYHDLAKEPEAFFHGLLLGFIASLQETHEIKSNRESGLGRYDLMLIPKDISQRGVVMELKAKRVSDTILLEALAKDALKQLEEKHYTAEFKQRGIHHIMKIGIAFEGKQLALCSAEEK